MSRPLSHAESLLPSIEELLDDCGLSKRQVELIVVNRGPGSFTGLRIGMAVAKGMAQALRIPLVGVDGMRVYRMRYAAHRRLCVVIPSRRDLVYAQWFSGARANGDVGLFDAARLVERLAEEQRELTVTGSGAKPILERLGDHPWVTGAFEEGVQPSALWIARAGADQPPIDQLYEMEPLYVEPVLA